MPPEKKFRRRPDGYRGLLRIAGPVIVVVGIGLVAFSAMDFASTVGTEQTSKLNIAARRTLRAPAYGWCRWAGMTLIGAGVVVTSFGFELFASRKKEPERRESSQRKSINEPLGRSKNAADSQRPAGPRKPRD